VPSAVQLLREGRTAEMWRKYCGFLDLRIDEFMHIQRRLLLEQLELLADCELGRRLLRGAKPTTIEEFRRVVPLTTYHDYLPYLPERREDMLPAKPVAWVRTSGRTGEFGGKWVPLPRQIYEGMGRYYLGTLIVASARQRGEVNIEENDTYLYTVAPPPFISGQIMRAGRDEFPMRFVPSIEEAERMEFQERVEQAFMLAMETGIDYFAGISSVLLTMGEAFSHGASRIRLSKDMVRPASLYRVGKGLISSKLRGEPLEPRHVWTPKGITAGGMDVQIYRKRIESLWGVRVLEGYGCTEFGTVALQAWGARTIGMIPTPDCAFWEFLPESEYALWRANRNYQPSTCLVNEVQPGRYILVGTSLLGGAFVRYILGDLVQVLALGDPALDIDLPQIVVESRADDLIDLSSLVWLTERSLWQAFGALNLPYTEWVARKEIWPDEGPVVHLYTENGHDSGGDLAGELHEALIETMDDYRTFADIMKRNPVKVTVLSPGTFRGYMEQKRVEGAELGHLKPPRMQPREPIIEELKRISRSTNGTNISGRE
jgi:hypothetical protein